MFLKPPTAAHFVCGLYWIVSVLHQTEGGIGKSIPDTREISWDPRDFQSFGGVLTFSHHHHREWIRKSFPVDREGLTVLKSILLCWCWENGHCGIHSVLEAHLANIVCMSWVSSCDGWHVSPNELPLPNTFGAAMLSIDIFDWLTVSTYNQVKVWHFSRGIFTLVRSCPTSWEVVPPRETSGGFDFSRGKNQTKPTSHEEALNHTILTSHEEQNQTIPLLTSIKTIPSLHLTSIKNHTIPTSHE